MRASQAVHLPPNSQLNAEISCDTMVDRTDGSERASTGGEGATPPLRDFFGGWGDGDAPPPPRENKKRKKKKERELKKRQIKK